MKEKERVLDFLTRTAEALSVMFGSSCETLIHDMSAPGHPLVAIFNSHISGRSVGSTADIFGGDLGAVEAAEYIRKDAVNTYVVTRTGRHVKSTTIHYQGSGYHYALGINFDYTGLVPAVNTLRELTQTSANLDEHINSQRKLQLDDIFDDCVRSIGKPVVSMKKQDKLQLVALLLNRKVFDLQKSVSYVAEQLGVSRYTVYKYIHEIEEGAKN